MTETIEIKASAAQIQTDSATIGRVVESKQISGSTIQMHQPCLESATGDFATNSALAAPSWSESSWGLIPRCFGQVDNFSDLLASRYTKEHAA
jgi:hypothetical protein